MHPYGVARLHHLDLPAAKQARARRTLGARASAAHQFARAHTAGKRHGRGGGGCHGGAVAQRGGGAARAGVAHDLIEEGAIGPLVRLPLLVEAGVEDVLHVVEERPEDRVAGAVVVRVRSLLVEEAGTHLCSASCSQWCPAARPRRRVGQPSHVIAVLHHAEHRRHEAARRRWQSGSAVMEEFQADAEAQCSISAADHHELVAFIARFTENGSRLDTTMSRDERAAGVGVVAFVTLLTVRLAAARAQRLHSLQGVTRGVALDLGGLLHLDLWHHLTSSLFGDHGDPTRGHARLDTLQYHGATRGASGGATSAHASEDSISICSGPFSSPLVGSAFCHQGHQTCGVYIVTASRPRKA